MKTLAFRPYKANSIGCRDLTNALTEKLGYKVWRTTEFKIPKSDILVNWGGTGHIPERFSTVINHPSAVALATDKIRTFAALEGKARIPEWTTNKAKARTWPGIVFCRTANQHGGKGIVISKEGEPFPDAQLYVKYIPKDAEYRVHVFKGKAIDLVQKKRKNNWDGNRCQYVFNHDNGYIFARNDIAPPPGDVFNQAAAAVEALGLDFGAVDVIVKGTKAYVLEVNTAPGIEGTTLKRYTEAFEELSNV